MSKEERIEKEIIPNAPDKEPGHNIGNKEIEVVPYQESVIGHEISVDYEPDSGIEDIAIFENDDVFFADNDDVIVDVDSDMYGGPLPDDFYQADIEVFDLAHEIQFLLEEDTVFGDDAKKKGANQNSDFDFENFSS